MINCYILGDQKALETLTSHIEKFPITVLREGSLLNMGILQKASGNSSNLVFIDIDFIHKCRATIEKICRYCTIVYFGTRQESAFDALEAMGFDYLLLSLGYERFEKCIDRYIRFSLMLTPATTVKKREPIFDSFFIKDDSRGQKEIKIKCREVLFIEARENYVELHLIDKKYRCHNTMKEMEESLAESSFIRVHKSFIINYDKIASIEGNNIVLEYAEKHKIVIGNTYRKAFMERKFHRVIRKRSEMQQVDYHRYASFVSLLFNFLLASNLINDLF